MKQRLVFFLALICIAQLGVTLLREGRQYMKSNPVPNKGLGKISKPEKSDANSNPAPANSNSNPVPLDRDMVDPASSDRASLATDRLTPGSEPATTGNFTRLEASKTPEGRDPFGSLFKPANEAPADPRYPLTGFPLANLRLTATMKGAGGGYIASVETSTGKSFIVREGSPIGNRRGTVTKITASKVLISEPAQDPLGNTTIESRELALKNNSED